MPVTRGPRASSFGLSGQSAFIGIWPLILWDQKSGCSEHWACSRSELRHLRSPGGSKRSRWTLNRGKRSPRDATCTSMERSSAVSRDALVFRLIVMEHVAELAAIEPLAASRAFHEVMPLVFRLAPDAL